MSCAPRRTDRAVLQIRCAFGTWLETLMRRCIPPLLSDETPPHVVDVREPNEWAEGHLEGALHIPLSRLAANVHLLASQAPIVVMCQAGARSTVGASLLRASGLSNVLNAAGGINAWRQAQLPIVGEHVRLPVLTG
jgi:rhodanese-related sulfurtransferase